MSIASARIQYRWNRTIRTKSDRVTLVPTFKKKKPVVLTWDKYNLVYVSDPVDSPCGRHSAQLIVDGEFYPCDDFTIAAGMFEVNIYSKDTSSDEDKHLIASVPSKKIEFILKRAKDETSPRPKLNIQKESQSRMVIKSEMEESKNKMEEMLSTNVKGGYEDSFVKRKLDSKDHLGSPERMKTYQEKIHKISKDELNEEKEKHDIFDIAEKDLPVDVLNRTAIGDSSSQKIFNQTPGREAGTSAFQPFPAAYFPLFPCIFSVDRTPRAETGGTYQWSSEKITEIVTEDEEGDDNKSSVSSPRKYTKKSAEFESQADQLVASVEKTIPITSTDGEMRKSMERILEMEVAGHHSSASITTVKLRDEAAQTNNVSLEKQPKSDSAVQTGNSLDESHPDDDKNATDQFTEENDDKFEFDQWVNDELSNRSKTFDPQLVCDKLNKIIAQESDIECSIGDDAKEGSDENTSDKEMDSCSLSSIEEKSVEITFDSKTQYKDNEGNDQQERELEEYSENSHWKEKVSPQKIQDMKDSHSEKGVSPVRKIKSSDVMKISERYVEDNAKDSLETIRERVSERERQVRRLQQEIMLLEDSHRHLYQEKAQLLKNSQNQKINIEGNNQLMELNEDKQFLSKEVEALKSHVTEQEKTNANLEWEVQALRARLDDNDPAEVSQLIEEMRSLRDELTVLTKKNKDLYGEIVHLREENMQLKRQQNSHNASDAWNRSNDDDVDDGYVHSPEETADNKKERNKEEKECDPIDESNAADNKASPGIKEEVTTVKVVLKTPKKTLKSRHFSKLHSTKYSSSDSEGTEYQELPRESPIEKLSKSVSPCLAESTRIESASTDDLLKDKRTCAVQTLITALDQSTGTVLPSPPAHESKQQVKQQGLHRRKTHYRSPTKHSNITKSPGIYSKRDGSNSQSNSSSTDSLLEEADSLIRESMEHLLDGVREPGAAKNKEVHSKWSKKNIVQSGNSSFSLSSPPKVHGGSGDHVRTVSYHASLRGYGPFIPKTDSDLHDGYEVKFMHPRGGMSQGLVRYVGPLPDHHLDTYVGIELFQPIGDTNGLIKGKQIFRCEINKGIFVPLRKIVLAWER